MQNVNSFVFMHMFLFDLSITSRWSTTIQALNITAHLCWLCSHWFTVQNQLYFIITETPMADGTLKKNYQKNYPLQIEVNNRFVVVFFCYIFFCKFFMLLFGQKWIWDTLTTIVFFHFTQNDVCSVSHTYRCSTQDFLVRKKLFLVLKNSFGTNPASR